MDIVVNHQDGVCIVHAGARIDTVSAKAFGERLTDLIDGGAHRLVIDMGKVAYISSAGFRSLLVAAKKLSTADGHLALAGVNGEVRRLFDIAALTEFFPMWATAEEAVAKLAPTPGGGADSADNGANHPRA